MAIVNFEDRDRRVARESRYIVNEVLPKVAPAVFKGLMVVYIDGPKAINWLYNVGVDVSVHPLPFIFYMEKSSTEEAFFYQEQGSDTVSVDGVINWCNQIAQSKLTPVNFVAETQANKAAQ
jgi:hypothetical protein